MKTSVERLIFGFGCLMACFIFVYLHQYTIPYEDASIMYSYAENLAHFGVISYFPNGMPAEGASDFLFMILVALFVKMGIKTTIAVALINLGGAILGVYSLGKIFKSSKWLYFVSVLSFFLLPQFIAGLLGYGVVFYAGITLFLLSTYLNNQTNLFLITCLIHFLIRPIEGFASISLFLFYILDIRKKAKPQKLILRSILIFLLPIALFWLWRTYYFGHLFPLPFYIKTNCVKWLLIFNKDAIYFHYKLFVPFLFFLLLFSSLLFFLRKQKLQKIWGILISLCFLPLFFYSMADLDMNFALRYQLLPFIGLMVTGLLLSVNYSIVQFAIIATFSIPMFYLSIDQWLRAREFDWNNMYDIAKEINECNNGVGKLATTESGIVPWVTKMKTVDLWGLNTPKYTKRIPTNYDLKQFNPDIIIVHARNEAYDTLKYFIAKKSSVEKTWESMTASAFNYGFESKMYIIYLVPYDKRSYFKSYQRPWFSKIFDKHFGKPNFSNRNDIFMIKKDYNYAEKITIILEQHGAKKYD